MIHVPDRRILLPRGLYPDGRRRILTFDQWRDEAEARAELTPAVRVARGIRMMDGAFWLDQRTPFIFGDIASVTLAGTAKALYPKDNFPVLGSNYFSAFVGKALAIWMFGRITTVLTPGNGSFDVYWGTGADANGTIIVSSAALALTASQTNLSWSMQCMVRSRTIAAGVNSTLFGTGEAHFNVAVLASTLQPMLLPASVPAPSAVLDLTLANIVSVQFKRSGSTAETMQVHELAVIAMN